MKSIVSAGRSKNVADMSPTQQQPQIHGFCFANQYLNPPIFPLNPWATMNIPTKAKVSNLISGRASINSDWSQWASIPMNDFNDLSIMEVSSTLKTTHVMNTKYWVAIQLPTSINFGAELNIFLTASIWINHLCANRRTPCIAPHRTKFQEAPCHNPLKSMTIKILIWVRTVPFREPPRGIKM